ncbi:hypothetical protein ACFL6I_28270 [candidate division KSB1 bacterium]
MEFWLEGFKDPQYVDVNVLNGDVWIADTGNDRIIQLQQSVPNGYDLRIVQSGSQRFDTEYTGYTNPEALAVNQATGDCWIADTGNHRIVRISAVDQSEFVISGFLNPRGLDVNIKEGSCWVANTGDNEIVKIFPDIFQLEIQSPSSYNIDNDAGFHSSLSGYVFPWSISVNSSENIIWFSDDFKVVKIRESGNQLTVEKTIVNFNGPKSIVVNSGIKP